MYFLYGSTSLRIRPNIAPYLRTLSTRSLQWPLCLQKTLFCSSWEPFISVKSCFWIIVALEVVVATFKAITTRTFSNLWRVLRGWEFSSATTTRKLTCILGQQFWLCIYSYRVPSYDGIRAVGADCSGLTLPDPRSFQDGASVCVVLSEYILIAPGLGAVLSRLHHCLKGFIFPGMNQIIAQFLYSQLIFTLV